MQKAGFLITRLISINPYVTNRLSDHNNLDESILIFRGIKSISFYIFISFFDGIRVSKPNSPRFHIWCFSVCISIKRTPGIYGLSLVAKKKTEPGNTQRKNTAWLEIFRYMDL